MVIINLVNLQLHVYYIWKESRWTLQKYDECVRAGQQVDLNKGDSLKAKLRTTCKPVDLKFQELQCLQISFPQANYCNPPAQTTLRLSERLGTNINYYQ